MATVVYKNGPGIRRFIKKTLAQRMLGRDVPNFGESAGAPNSVPICVGDLVWDKTTSDLYVADSLVEGDPADNWTKIVD